MDLNRALVHRARGHGLAASIPGSAPGDAASGPASAVRTSLRLVPAAATPPLGRPRSPRDRQRLTRWRPWRVALRLRGLRPPSWCWSTGWGCLPCTRVRPIARAVRRTVYRLARRHPQQRLSRHKAARPGARFLFHVRGIGCLFSGCASTSTATNSARRWISKADRLCRQPRSRPALNLAIRWICEARSKLQWQPSRFGL